MVCVCVWGGGGVNIQYVHREGGGGVLKKKKNSAHQGCIYLIKNTLKTVKIAKYYDNLKQLIFYVSIC